MNFRLTTRKGINYVVVDMAKVTPKEMEIVNTYVTQGYKVASKKVKNSSSKKGTVTKSVIEDYAKETKNQKLLDMLKNKVNFMKLKSEYNKIVNVK